MAPRPSRYYNVEPTAQNFRALWDRLHDLDDLVRAAHTTIASQDSTIQLLQTQIGSVGQQAARALAQASQVVNLQGMPASLPGGSTPGGDGGGGSTPVEDFVIPDQSLLVQTTVASLPPLVTLADIFKVPQTVAWSLRAQQIDGADFPLGLLIKEGGDNIYTCGGVSYSVSRVCYPNGHIFKILGDAGPGGNNSPQWVDDGFVAPERYGVATDPSAPC